MDDFETNVFVNCPFDEDYRQLLLSVVFTVKHLGFNPRLSLERVDSAESRIEKIVDLINQSKFGIHDISRIVSQGENEHYRMNMPFELGIDYGCKKLKGGIWSQKQILILEKERYRYQRALSDLSGSDIKSHDDETYKIIKAVRDWFVTTESMRSNSGKTIWNLYNDFQAYLYDAVIENDGHESVDDVQITEIMHHMSDWFNNQET